MSIVPEFICHPIIIIVVMQACLISNFHNLLLTQESCYSRGAVRGMSGTPVHLAAFLLQRMNAHLQENMDSIIFVFKSFFFCITLTTQRRYYCIRTQYTLGVLVKLY